MKLAADECCDALLVTGLGRDGHDVWYVMESARGMDDLSILRHAAADERVLVTEDKDFGELVVRLRLGAMPTLVVGMQNVRKTQHGHASVALAPALLTLREASKWRKWESTSSGESAISAFPRLGVSLHSSRRL